MSYPIAYQLYSSRMFPPLEKHYPKLKAMGYEAIEPWLSAYEADAKAFRKSIGDAGLECFGFHFPAIDIIEDTQRYIDYADALEARYLIPAYLDSDDRPTDSETWKLFADRLFKIRKIVEQAGKNLIWHNHEFEFKELDDGLMGIDYIVQAGLRLEIDLAWIQVASLDPLSELKRLSTHIEIVQTKDKRADNDKREFGFARPGVGKLNWEKIKRQVDKIKPDHLVVEHDLPDDWEEFAKLSIHYIRALGY